MKINKKQAGIIAGVACVIILILLLLTMCNGSGDGSKQDVSTQPVETTATTGETTQPSEETTEATEETEEATEETTEATEEATEPSDSSSSGGSTKPGGTGGFDTNYDDSYYDNDDDSGSSDPVTETAPAAGSAESPYMETVAALPDSFSTVTIAEDSAVSFLLQGADGSMLTIEDPDAYVIYDGKTYKDDDEDGMVSVAIAAAETEAAPVFLQVGSLSKEAKSYILRFYESLGGESNPETIVDVDGIVSIQASLEAGDADGYYYQYVAEENGTLTLQLDAITENVNCDIIVTVGESVVKLSDSEDGTVSVDMKAEDTALIQIVAVPAEDGTYPEAQVSISGVMEDAPGTSGNPIVIFGQFPIETDVINPGASIYYSVYGADGLTLRVEDSDACVTVNGVTYNAIDGVISADIVAASPRDPVTILIGNGGETAESYTVNFISPVGAMDNPAELVIGTNTAPIKAGSADGYWFTWTAEAEGTLTINMPDDIGWLYTVTNVTDGTYYDTQYSDAENAASSFSILVAQEDVLSIMVSSYDPANPWSAPECDLAFEASFVEHLKIYYRGITGLSVDAGASVYCHAMINTNIITNLIITGTEDFCVEYEDVMYTSVDNVVKIEDIESSTYDPTTFTITNTGETDATFSIAYENPVGTSPNPHEIVEMGEYTVSVVGDGEGYFFTWSATDDGVLTVSLKSDDWTYVVNNLSTYNYGAIHNSDSGDDSVETISVSRGDNIQINVGTASRKNKEVVIDISFQASEAEAAAASAEVVDTAVTQVVYEGDYIPDEYVLSLRDDQNLVYVDLTEANRMFKDESGFYHIGSEDGPLVYVDFTSDAFVNLAKLLEENTFCYETTSEDGTVTKEIYNELMNKYLDSAVVIEISGEETKTLYPLTRDLMYMIKKGGAQLGWFDSAHSGYLFKDITDLDSTSAWMFSCCYAESAENVLTVGEETVTEPQEIQVEETEADLDTGLDEKT